MTFGGGVAGIGFDVSGLGEEGVSLISANECNEQGSCQDQYLGRQEHDGPRDAPRCLLEDALVVLVAPIEIARCGGLHLSKVGIVRLRRLEQLTAEEADVTATRKQGGATLTHAQRICHRTEVLERSSASSSGVVAMATSYVLLETVRKGQSRQADRGSASEEWARQDSNLRPIDYESTALTN